MRKIKNFIKKNNIQFVEVVFVDLLGNIRQIIITTEHFYSSFKNGLKFDGSSVCCLNNVDCSDTSLFFDKDSFYILPNGNLMIFCFLDSGFDARKNLDSLQYAIFKQTDGYCLNFGAELEFFLFDKDFCNNLSQHGAKHNYLTLIEQKQQKCLTEVAEFCKKQIFIEALHHECAPHQFEITFRFNNPLKTADNIIFLKRVIKHFANLNGLQACFMPKPLNNASGSGMHVNISVFRKNKNLFYDGLDQNNLSQLAYGFMQNVFKHIGAITALTNPIVNSYKRLNSGFEAPNMVDYSAKNRSSLIRLPAGNKNSTRIELRLPDVSCNPYLAFCAILLAGFENLFDVETENLFIKQLPHSLSEALCFLKQDNLISKLVPKTYISKKEAECQLFETTVTNLDIKQYFNI